jgi:hypothetical protein
MTRRRFAGVVTGTCFGKCYLHWSFGIYIIIFYPLMVMRITPRKYLGKQGFTKLVGSVPQYNQVLPTDKNKVCRSFYMLKIGPLK